MNIHINSPFVSQIDKIIFIYDDKKDMLMTSLNKGDSIYGIYDVGIFGSVGGQR